MWLAGWLACRSYAVPDEVDETDLMAELDALEADMVLEDSNAGPSYLQVGPCMWGAGGGGRKGARPVGRCRPCQLRSALHASPRRSVHMLTATRYAATRTCALVLCAAVPAGA